MCVFWLPSLRVSPIFIFEPPLSSAWRNAKETQPPGTCFLSVKNGHNLPCVLAWFVLGIQTIQDKIMCLSL